MHDGKIYKFDIFTSSFNYKICGTNFNDNPITDAKLFENGFVCITQNMTFYVINDLKEPNAVQFFSFKKLFDNYTPSDYLFISPNHSKSGQLELLVPHPNHGLIQIFNSEVKYMKTDHFVNYSKMCGTDGYQNEDMGRITNIIMSPSNQYIALFNETGNMYVFHTTLDQNLSENPRIVSMTKLSLKFGGYQMLWCAEDCVVISTNGVLFLIGPDDKLLKVDIVRLQSSNSKVNVHCISEVDGVRIFAEDSVEFLQKVPDELYLSIFPFSVDPAKKLLEAYRFAEEKRANCDEEIRKIRADLPDAVNKLMTAATSMWNFSDQLYLTKAAQHGKTFLGKDEFNFNNFVGLCKDLRILNNLRTFESPRLITYEQYKKLETKDLIQFLIKTQNFFLANEISLFMHLKVRKVYQKWAIAQIKNLPSSLSSNEELGFYNMIQNKLSEVQGISYIKLAKKAFKFGKGEIGIKFLENEKSILTKIPQYVELRKWDDALELAFETYDSNVIYTIIDKIMTTESIETFKAIVVKHKKADAVVLDYLNKNHQGLVKDYLELKRNYEDLFFHMIEQFFAASSLDQRRRCIKEAKNYLKTIETVKDYSFDVKFYRNYLTDMEQSLFFKRDMLNENIIRQTDISSFDNSIHDVYKMMIKEEKFNMVEQKNKYFEMSPRKMAILRIRTYSEMNRFDAISLMGQNIRSSNLHHLNFAELYLDSRIYPKAVEHLKKITEEDYFDFKLVMLKYME